MKKVMAAALLFATVGGVQAILDNVVKLGKPVVTDDRVIAATVFAAQHLYRNGAQCPLKKEAQLPAAGVAAGFGAWRAWQFENKHVKYGLATLSLATSVFCFGKSFLPKK